MASAGQNMGGSEEVEMEQDEDGEYTGNFVVRARAIMFPILVHELIKGYYDILGATLLYQLTQFKLKWLNKQQIH
jgi:hypothetical protein